MTLHPGFTLAEDEALKLRLSGMTISDFKNNSRDVDVWFRWPDGVKTVVYPFITIDLLDIALDTETVESFGYITPDYIPSIAPDARAAQDPVPGDDQGLVAVRFLPVKIYYQVTAHSRSYSHDRQLMAQLRTINRLPFRYGYLDVPEDNTRRNLDVLEFRPHNSVDAAVPAAQGKRSFNQFYTVCINAEFSPALIAVMQKVATVDLTLLHQVTPFNS